MGVPEELEIYHMIPPIADPIINPAKMRRIRDVEIYNLNSDRIIMPLFISIEFC